MASRTIFPQWQSTAQLIWILQLVLISCVVSSANARPSDDQIVQDISIISKHWGNLRPYEENAENVFGVKDTGLPDGCQVEQVQMFHRHGARYAPPSEFGTFSQFATKVTTRAAGDNFQGELSFLNTWSLRVTQDALVASGAAMAYKSGTDFWDRYGRLLYNAVPGQTFYNATGQDKPLVRCNTFPRVFDTANVWADGYFGPYNATSKYKLLAIPVALQQNNTLASYVSCQNFLVPGSGIQQSQGSLLALAPVYLENARQRFSQDAPPSVTFTTTDAFAMQELCVYEYVALGSSEFCKLFTLGEWKDYEYVLDSYYYKYASFGSVAGRAYGLGILQEILARLKNEYITSSESSVNSTLDSNPETFPLNQKFYADFTHDIMLWSTLTAMSLDYFRQPLPVSLPPPPKRHFRTAVLAPYAARLVVEKIGCTASRPQAKNVTATQYSSSQYGYSASSATNKFVRIRLNNGILPLRSIRGGKCRVRGRSDGLCPLQNFIESQANAAQLANYQTICFKPFNFTSSNFDGDGNYFP